MWAEMVQMAEKEAEAPLEGKECLEDWDFLGPRASLALQVYLAQMVHGERKVTEAILASQHILGLKALVVQEENLVIMD